MKPNWIFLFSVFLYCLFSLAALHAVHSGMLKMSNINCSMFTDGVSPSNLYSTMNGSVENATIGLEPNVTDICIATFVGENTTVITKRPVSAILTISEMHLELLNKSALRTHFIHVCDSECEQQFNSGHIYMKGDSQNDSKYFLQYYTNYRCVDPVPPIDSTTLEYYLRTVSLFFMCLSVLACSFYVVRFIVDKNLRTLPGSCILCLCIADLVLYPFFFAMKIAPFDKNTKFLCPVYLYTTLANWFWINVITFDLWKTIRLAIVKFRRTTAKILIIRFIYYSIYAWGTPLIMTFLIVYPFSSDQKYVYHGGFSKQGKNMAELYVAVPLFLIQLLNFILFYSSVYMIFKDSKSKSQPERSEVSIIKRNFLFFIRMSFAMGIIWILGMIGYFAKIEILTYIYIYAKILEAPYIVFFYAVWGRAKDTCKNCSVFCTSKTDSEITTS